MHTVDTREVARVVIGHRAVLRWRGQFAFVDQLLQKLSVVRHLERVAELRVIMCQRVEAVRALGENFSGTVLLESGVVGLGQFLKQELIAHPPRGIAGATFVRAEHGEVDAGLD